MLDKLRANLPLSHSDIKAVEVEIKTWLQLYHPSCDMVATLNGMLRYVLTESQSTLTEAFESLPNTFGDTSYKVYPDRSNQRGRRVARHYSTAKD